MKTTISVIVLTLFTTLSFAQDFSQLANFDFGNASSYKPQEQQVLQCANYLFETPNNNNDVNRAISTQFIIKWMTGTPEYSFDLDQNAMELTKGSNELFGLYMAAMTKVVLDHPNKKLSAVEIYNQSEKLLVAYCADVTNKLKPSKKIKKIIKAKA